MLNIALFGPPGAGKGTQAKKIVEKYGLVHISTGDMIRKEIAEGSDLGIKARSVIESGNLLSDELVIAMILDNIEQNRTAKGFLFDGFPRTVNQAVKLDEMLKERDIPLCGLLKIYVPKEELKRRIIERGKIEGRKDDTEEVLENRFREYEEKTVHVSHYYEKQGLCYDIAGDKDIETVFSDICRIVEQWI